MPFTDHPFIDLKEALAVDFLTVKCFLDDKYDVVAQYLSILNDEYGITLGSWRQGSLYVMSTYEKDDITATLADLSSLLICLSDYISVTRRAVKRLSSKSTERLEEVEKLREVLQEADARWINDLQCINTILRDLHLDKAIVHGGVSLLLSNLGFNESPQILEDATRALQEDSVERLQKSVQDEALQAANPSSEKFLLVLTKIAILCSSSKCLPFLVSQLGTNHDLSQSVFRNPLRHWILHAAQLRHHNIVDQDAHQGVQLVLDNLPPLQRSNVLLCPDSFGRLPLHYAAQHGMAAVCRDMIQRLDSRQDPETEGNLPIFLIADHLGETPLSISIAEGHDEILKLFLSHLAESEGQAFPPGRNKFKEILHKMVSLAIRSQRTSITDLVIEHETQLVTSHFNVHELLYLASQYGQTSIVERLSAHISDINVGEPLRGWTPLMVASIYEHVNVVEILLAHPSCDVHVRDYSGWTAVDHAAFKGPPALVKTLQGQGEGQSVSLEWTKHAQRIDISAHRPERRNHASVAIELEGEKRDRSHLFMNIGHFDMEKEPLILQVDPFRDLVAPMQISDSSLTLEISAIDCEASGKYLVSFPVLEDLSNDPFHFTAEDHNAAKLLFKVHCSVLGSDNHLPKQTHIGSAVVSLKDLRQGLGSSLESLERDHTVSLISPDAFGNNYVGTFTFTFVISKPFMFQGPPPTPSAMVLRRDDSPLIAGHRGK